MYYFAFGSNMDTTHFLKLFLKIVQQSLVLVISIIIFLSIEILKVLNYDQVLQILKNV